MSDQVFAQARAEAAQPDQGPRASRRRDLPIGERHDLLDRDVPGPIFRSSFRAADFSRVPVHGMPLTDHVHFAPGRFAPGTEPGDRLLAHELAHVAQQHRSGPFAPGTAAELDADAAAAAVLRGGAPQIRASVGAGRHEYEAWEHREVGDADGSDHRKIASRVTL